MFDFSKPVPEGMVDRILAGLGVTVIGVIIVFAVLILIMIVIYLFQKVFGAELPKKETKSSAPAVAKKAEPVAAPAATGNPEELVAAIAAATAMAQEELIVVLAAAVAAQEGCDPASSRYRIRSFRRIL